MDWTNIMTDEWKAEILLSSVPLWRYNSEDYPVANASGCLIDYKGTRFILSIAHASIASKEWCFEISPCVADDNGDLRTVYQPITMNILTEFHLPEDGNDFTEPKLVDFTYRKIKSDTQSEFQLHCPDGQIFYGKRKVFQPDFDIIPSATKKYGFFGQVRFSGVEGNRIVFSNRMEDNLSFVGVEDGFYIFKLPHAYGSHASYQGCSGAPIIDEDGNLVSLVSHGQRSTSYIYGIDINRYRAALDIEARP